MVATNGITLPSQLKLGLGESEIFSWSPATGRLLLQGRQRARVLEQEQLRVRAAALGRQKSRFHRQTVQRINCMSGRFDPEGQMRTEQFST